MSFFETGQKNEADIYLTSGERKGEVVNLKCAASKGVHHVTAAEVFVEISQPIVQILKGAERSITKM